MGTSDKTFYLDCYPCTVFLNPSHFYCTLTMQFSQTKHLNMGNSKFQRKPHYDVGGKSGEGGALPSTQGGVGRVHIPG